MSLFNQDGQKRREQKLTIAQAGAVITSEVDLAIEKWNKQAIETQKEEAHTFKQTFEQFAYAEGPAKQTGQFGYALLKITATHKGVDTVIYSKNFNAKTEAMLDNTNGYYPNMIIDCLGFLIASGLMYNLAINNPIKDKAPKNATKVNKSGTPAKG